MAAHRKSQEATGFNRKRMASGPFGKKRKIAGGRKGRRGRY